MRWRRAGRSGEVRRVDGDWILSRLAKLGNPSMATSATNEDFV